MSIIDTQCHISFGYTSQGFEKVLRYSAFTTSVATLLSHHCYALLFIPVTSPSHYWRPMSPSPLLPSHLLPFSHFVHSLPLSPLATTSWSSVFIVLILLFLFIHFVLDSTCEWNYMVFLFLSLAYST